MKPFRIFPIFAAAVLAMAQPPQDPAQSLPQSSSPTNGGWKKMGPAVPDTPPLPAGPANDPNQNGPQPPAAGPQSIPAQLTIKAGTYVTVRVNQMLSSDRNQAGDAFSATLVRPIVVDGIVVADRGQTLGGKVTEAKKAGRVSGTSRLALQLTDLPVVDGQQLPIQTSLVSRNGPTSVGRDAAAIAGTTALGAAAGAVADWGRGAAIGAGAGAFVGVVGVLLTRGYPTIVTPESVLTFRVEQPVTVSTEHAPQAFRFVEPGEYNAPPRFQTGGPGPGPGYGAPPPAAYYYGPGYYPYAYPYPYPYYWGFYGPGFFWGPRVVFRGRFR